MSIARVLLGFAVAALAPVAACSLFAPSDEELMGDRDTCGDNGHAGAAQTQGDAAGAAAVQAAPSIEAGFGAMAVSGAGAAGAALNQVSETDAAGGSANDASRPSRRSR
jgi:hypothetical protein